MKNICLLLGLFVVTVISVSAQSASLPRLAVVPFSTNLNNERIQADAVAVRDIVQTRMVATGRYTMITRDEIDTLIANQQIQVSAIASTENIRRLQLANISYVVTGSVNAMGNDYLITVRVLDVSTGQYAHSDDDFIGSASRELFNGVNTLMVRFVSGMTMYRIGDTGPAGGIVFYDKGSYSDGWRYLEAAPAHTEFQAEWGTYRRTDGEWSEWTWLDVSGISEGIGSGRRNTQLISEVLRGNWEVGRAAQRVTQLNINGFTDWFLPSKDELNLMFINLRQRGLGGFRTNNTNNWTDFYWSSSQTNISGAWAQRFSDGRQSPGNKNDTRSVRGVRAF